VSYESIRLWAKHSGVLFAKRLKRRHRGFGDTLFIDEVFVKIKGKLSTASAGFPGCACGS